MTSEVIQHGATIRCGGARLHRGLGFDSTNRRLFSGNAATIALLRDQPSAKRGQGSKSSAIDLRRVLASPTPDNPIESQLQTGSCAYRRNRRSTW